MYKQKFKKSEDIVIRLKDIYKEYISHHEKPTLVEKFVKSVRFKRDEKFLALKNINLTIKKGERVGIIGPNGSGKTTLLKIITGITTPTSGTVETFGKIVSLIDLEAGFHPDLTGYQNIFLNGMLLGMSKSEIEKKLTKIIKFADIKQFIDAPMFTYSSGMRLRLGFAVSIHADPDILVLDENMSVADWEFNIKCHKTLMRMLQSKLTLIFVSHEMLKIHQYCKKIFKMEKGRLFA